MVAVSLKKNKVKRFWRTELINNNAEHMYNSYVFVDVADGVDGERLYVCSVLVVGVLLR